MPEALQPRSSRLERIRKAEAELAAEAAEAETRDDDQRSKRAAGRSRGTRQRAAAAQKLAVETALAAGLESPLLRSGGAPLAMPSRQLPARPGPTRSGISRILTATFSKAPAAGCRAMITGAQSTVTTR